MALLEMVRRLQGRGQHQHQQQQQREVVVVVVPLVVEGHVGAGVAEAEAGGVVPPGRARGVLQRTPVRGQTRKRRRRSCRLTGRTAC
jgi:hypothetical protein